MTRCNVNATRDRKWRTSGSFLALPTLSREAKMATKWSLASMERGELLTSRSRCCLIEDGMWQWVMVAARCAFGTALLRRQTSTVMTSSNITRQNFYNLPDCRKRWAQAHCKLPSSQHFERSAHAQSTSEQTGLHRVLQKQQLLLISQYKNKVLKVMRWYWPGSSHGSCYRWLQWACSSSSINLNEEMKQFLLGLSNFTPTWGTHRWQERRRRRWRRGGSCCKLAASLETRTRLLNILPSSYYFVYKNRTYKFSMSNNPEGHELFTCRQQWLRNYSTHRQGCLRSSAAPTC